MQVQQRASRIATAIIASVHHRKAISQEHTFAEDITDMETLWEALPQQTEQVRTVLQRKHLYATVVKVKLR